MTEIINNAARTKPRAAADETIERFAVPVRARLRQLAHTSAGARDIIVSFPAAAVALASGRADRSAHARALAELADGANLRAIAQTLSLPRWLRGLPPEAIGATLPARALLPADDEVFGRAMLNRLPAQFAPNHVWLDRVALARSRCDDDFAVWLGAGGADVTEAQVSVLAAHDFFSKHAELHAHALVGRGWAPRTPIPCALTMTKLWLVRVQLKLQAENRGAKAVTPILFAGYSFEPLETAEALAAEGRAMRHCVGDYAMKVALGMSRIFSMRRAGRRIATAEYMTPDWAKPELNQVCGVENARPPAHAAMAARLFASTLVNVGDSTPSAPSIGAWRRFWAPYWAAKGAHAPFMTSPRSITYLIDCLS